MRKLKEKLGLTILILIIGLIFGSFLGELLGKILPDSAVKKVMTSPLEVGFHPFTLDLHIFTVIIGFMLKVNLFGFIGILVLGYLLKWIY
ncbi:MAG: DUF4321 domain-containing protein [candidate division WOR-3 bacterium]